MATRTAAPAPGGGAVVGKTMSSGSGTAATPTAAAVEAKLRTMFQRSRDAGRSGMTEATRRPAVAEADGSGSSDAGSSSSDASSSGRSARTTEMRGSDDGGADRQSQCGSGVGEIAATAR
ncbi:hypothetical protein Scep_023665 [Stephania cephalantha]|uniref:Uncharacterized protein n=1 Tax=Stephania cephalantha TaxID=152367 RepID=A0AAP0EXU9_9MAGN